MADSQIPPARVCTKCKQSYPATKQFFFASRHGRFSLKSVCKDCHQKANVVLLAISRRRDPERFRAYGRDHRERHGDDYRAQERGWSKVRREKKRSELRAYHAEWSSKNVEKVRRKRIASEAKRRAAKIGAGGSYSAQDVAEILSNQRGLCFYCGSVLGGFHVDHFIPLSKGGDNSPKNLRLACSPCNLSKGPKLPWEWRPQQFNNPIGVEFGEP